MAVTATEILTSLKNTFGTALDEAWVNSLIKTAHSKNITTADWNALLVKTASTASGTEKLYDSLCKAIEVFKASDDAHSSDITSNSGSLAEHASKIATLESEIGKLPVSLDLTITEDYKLQATLKRQNNTVLYTSVIDLPIEELTTKVEYDSAQKGIVVHLKNGSTTLIPLTDISSTFIADLKREVLDGYATDEELIAGIRAAIAEAEVVVADGQSIATSSSTGISRVKGIYPVNSVDTEFTTPIKLFIGKKADFEALGDADRYNTLALFTDEDPAIARFNEALALYNAAVEACAAIENMYSKILDGTEPVGKLKRGGALVTVTNGVLNHTAFERFALYVIAINVNADIRENVMLYGGGGSRTAERVRSTVSGSGYYVEFMPETDLSSTKGTYTIYKNGSLATEIANVAWREV